MRATIFRPINLQFVRAQIIRCPTITATARAAAAAGAFRLHNRAYTTETSEQPASNTTSTSLLKITDIPAPHTGSIKLVLLNNPTSKNAISTTLLSQLSQLISEISLEAGKGPTRALVLGSCDDGPKGVFCAGADLRERRGMTQAQTVAFLAKLNETLTSLSKLNIPTITAIPCHAHGGGLEMALCTDLRVCLSSAQLSLPETRLGIIPGAGGTARLPPLVGKSRALDMIFTGRRLGAQEALEWGLVNRVVEDGVNDAAMELAKTVCEGGPLAIVAAKRAITFGGSGDPGVEGLAYGGVVDSEDKYEALKAFAEKRKPIFKGK